MRRWLCQAGRGRRGGRERARGCLWHTASIWHWWHRKKRESPLRHCRQTHLPLYSVYLTAQHPGRQWGCENQACVSRRCGGLSVCAVNVDGSRFMVISSQGRQCYAGLGGHGQVKHKGRVVAAVNERFR